MSKNADMDRIGSLLTRGVHEVIVGEQLQHELAKGTKLRVKLGMDPTAPDLHLGHAVVLRKLRAFQELGHEVIVIIGDYTARIGDPSGKSKTRPPLEGSQIDANAKTYFDQVGKILDMRKVEVRHNSEWLGKLSFADILKLAAHFTVARVTERDDFAKRLKEGTDVGLHELLYPLMQAYDSVAISATVELGGADQKFNLLAGRELQKKLGKPEQNIITCPLLVGLDGQHKMSKSLGNYIGITEVPEQMYGKTMTIPDTLIMHWFELATTLPDADLASIRTELADGVNPRDLKMRLAREIVAAYHGSSAALKAEEVFIKTFQKKEIPDEVPEKKFAGESIPLVDVLMALAFVSSKSDARRTIEQKGVKVDGAVVDQIDAEIKLSKKGVLIQKGKRFFVRVHN